MSLPGIARHIVTLRLAAALHPADRYSITQQDCIATTGICQQVECDFFPRATDADRPHAHPLFDKDLDHLAIEEIHVVARWFSATAERVVAAAAMTCPREIPPSLGGTRWCQ